MFHSPQDVFPRLPPSSAGTCDSHRGRRAVWLRMSLEKHVGDNDGARERGGGGRKEKKKKVPQGFWGPAKQLNGCKQHHSPHVQTFKISACVMGSAWPLSGCTEHRRSLPTAIYRNGWLVPHQCCGLMSKDRQDLLYIYISILTAELLWHISGCLCNLNSQVVALSRAWWNHTERRCCSREAYKEADNCFSILY